MFTIVVPGQQEDNKTEKNCGSRNEIADVKANLLLNVDDEQVGNTATGVHEPREPVEERVNGQFTKPLHLPQHDRNCKFQPGVLMQQLCLQKAQTQTLSEAQQL